MRQRWPHVVLRVVIGYLNPCVLMVRAFEDTAVEESSLDILRFMVIAHAEATAFEAWVSTWHLTWNKSMEES